MSGHDENWDQYYDATDMDSAVSDWEDDRAKADRKFAQRPVDGEHIYRLLPKRKGAKHKHFYRVVYLHFLHHPTKKEELLGVFLCPLKTEGYGEAECNLCTGASRVKKTGVEWKQLRDWGLLPSRSMYSGAVRLDSKGQPIDDDKDETTKPHIMTVPYDVEGTIMPLLKKDSARYMGDLSHPITGFNMVITKTGKGREGTEYSAMPLPKSCPLPNLEWLKELPNLDNLEEQAGAQSVRLLGEFYPGAGFPAPDGVKALPAVAGSTSTPDDDDEYSLVADPDNPGAMVSMKELREREDPPIGG